MKKDKFINIKDIKNNPKLFYKIYDEWSKHFNYQVRELYTPQELADMVMLDAKNGEEYAQFLKVQKTEIEVACEKHALSRKQLAEILDVKVHRLNNCISRGRCSKDIKKLIKEKLEI